MVADVIKNAKAATPVLFATVQLASAVGELKEVWIAAPLMLVVLLAENKQLVKLLLVPLLP